MTFAAAFRFDNSFARDLEGFYVARRPAVVPAPSLLYLNEPLANELGLDISALGRDAIAAIFAGNALPDGAQPLAQAYAGHQFGGFSPQLGDGRALLLGEVIDRHGRRRDIAFKGSGRTPFARGGDGKAAVGPMLREVLIGEAMHALGIPTTRALAVTATGEPVYREQVLPGAVLTRVAASHLRVGTFQFHAARGDIESVRKLAEYTIARHDPELAQSPQRFLALLQNVAERQASLIAQWMNVGFIHGVMNTDNMTISGETIDYGPCAFIEAYDPATVFSSIDDHGRYAFGNQPDIACWNLARLAEALLPLLSDNHDEAVAMATDVIARFPAQYRRHLLAGQRAKLGLRRAEPATTCMTARWSTTGYGCFMQGRSISRSRGAGSPTRLAVAKRRFARSSPTHTASMRGLPAGARAAQAKPAPRCRRQHASAPMRCAASIPSSSPATTGWRKRLPPRRIAVISRPSGDCSMPSGDRTTRPTNSRLTPSRRPPP